MKNGFDAITVKYVIAECFSNNCCEWVSEKRDMQGKIKKFSGIEGHHSKIQINFFGRISNETKFI
jgi:hypothetical protein